MPDATTKRCSICKTDKPVSEFGLSSQSKDGLKARCLGCSRTAASAYYETTRDPKPLRVVECAAGCGKTFETIHPRARFCSRTCLQREYDQRRSTPLARYCRKCGVEVHTRVGFPVCENCRVDRRPYLAAKERQRTLRKYGLTEADWDRMLTEQGGRCAICHTDTPGGRGERWHIDHCHATDRVRGLLCHNCNVGIGNFKDDPTLLESAAAYLRAVV